MVKGRAAWRWSCVYSMLVRRSDMPPFVERSAVRKMKRKAWEELRWAPVVALLGVGLASCGQAPQPVVSHPGETGSAAASSAAPAWERHDLSRDEQRGGHTLERHVARTDEELRERLQRERNISAASTWTDRETAEETIAEALRAERGHIENWMRHGYPRANLALHFGAGRDIGRSLRRGETETVHCRDAVIVLRADGPDDYYVLTAYPEARE